MGGKIGTVDKSPGVGPKKGSSKLNMPRGLWDPKEPKGLKGVKVCVDGTASVMKRSSKPRKIESKSSKGSLKKLVERKW